MVSKFRLKRPMLAARRDQKVKLTSTYVVEKGKPLASPA